MATNFCRMVTYINRFLPITSHDFLIPYSSKIMWQTKTIISPLPPCLWLLNFAKRRLTWRVSYVSCCSTLWPRDLSRWRDKLKPFFVNYRNAYDRQTDLLKNSSTTWMSMAIKLGIMVTYNMELPSIKSHIPLITCSWNFTWWIKYVISNKPQWPWSSNLARWLQIMKSFLSQSLKIPWSVGLARSRCKLNTLYHYYHKAYDHEIQ